jgi:hypothetical protein
MGRCSGAGRRTGGTRLSLRDGQCNVSCCSSCINASHKLLCTVLPSFTRIICGRICSYHFESHLRVRDNELFQIVPPNDDNLKAGASTQVQCLELMRLDDQLQAAPPMSVSVPSYEIMEFHNWLNNPTYVRLSPHHVKINLKNVNIKILQKTRLLWQYI